ncbi:MULTISPECIES: DUF2218 domain-containing protein [unclassified Pseudofrankia]|uniref:DUF2218 domain-containing protein n=1 Tax=unclassified Pseudofrankia TaxID=2994372 RepID=UPI0008DAE907|nr:MULTISPECIES: DUF2218 domain-containing protein [unclassified Pseudofrankia]MDT3446190.1 DUF2218 domain-containing protein [Pseudofrankia sp. BMG5.37]OHV72994.1 hypothetical protein BCD48_33700 [Pseudofrankia sp. BMG5.36]
MPTADARIATDRAPRYLTQLCGHLDAIHNRHQARHSGHDMPRIQTVTQTGNIGLLEFDRGTCRLEATDNALVLSADAADTESLEQIKMALTRRLETIGGREGLRLTWLAD